MYQIIGVPEENKSFIMDNIVEGSVTYEELESGSKVVIDRRAANGIWEEWGLGIKSPILQRLMENYKKTGRSSSYRKFSYYFAGILYGK